MKKFKLLSSIAAVAAISCVAAASSMAEDVIELQLDTAASTNSSKVINVYYKGTSLANVQSITYIDIVFEGADESKITLDSEFPSIAYEMYEGAYEIQAKGSGLVEFDGDACLLATLTVDNADALKMTLTDAKIAGGRADKPTMKKTISPDFSNYAVINAEGVEFEAGEGDAAKAFMATAAGEGVITWNVTDGTNVATATGTTVTGGAEVVAGLVVTGANAGNISYAAVTID